MKKNEKDYKKDKALFIQRLAAYIIDILIVSVVASMLSIAFIDSDAINKLSENSVEIMDKYTKGDINEKTYLSETANISYQMARKTGIQSLIIVFLEILYFIVYQFYKGGQTIGKRLLKIKVVSLNEGFSMNQMIIRVLIINSILLDMILIGFVTFAPQNIYYYGTVCFELIQYTIILISVFMVMFSKSGMGLHDIITHTRVVKINN